MGAKWHEKYMSHMQDAGMVTMMTTTTLVNFNAMSAFDAQEEKLSQ